MLRPRLHKSISSRVRSQIRHFYWTWLPKPPALANLLSGTRRQQDHQAAEGEFPEEVAVVVEAGETPRGNDETEGADFRGKAPHRQTTKR